MAIDVVLHSIQTSVYDMLWVGECPSQQDIATMQAAVLKFQRLHYGSIK